MVLDFLIIFLKLAQVGKITNISKKRRALVNIFLKLQGNLFLVMELMKVDLTHCLEEEGQEMEILCIMVIMLFFGH